ncbi:hypothetical protein EWB00_008523 [Schistosoma japonicum]|uniref:Uncharacterized protein n=1 Tax=Schistosoma japonicum TaxID=6182 RepID=A0A4Z2CQ41_SCHJA|nr:hypothetical protein EWB00_008523 [Schistosoma japonicum]
MQDDDDHNIRNRKQMNVKSSYSSLLLLCFSSFHYADYKWLTLEYQDVVSKVTLSTSGSEDVGIGTIYIQHYEDEQDRKL